ncbi:MAG: hypothetical protein QXK06_04965, partial [Candidatus Diapherotrites archaeon]
ERAKSPAQIAMLEEEMQREIALLQEQINSVKIEIERQAEKERMESPRAVSPKGYKPYHVARLLRKGANPEKIAMQTGFTMAEINAIKRKTSYSDYNQAMTFEPTKRLQKLREKANLLEVRKRAIQEFLEVLKTQKQ